MSIPFARPSVDATDIARVVEVLQGGWLSTGPKVMELEKLFSSLHDGLPTIAVNSATEAMAVGLQAYGIGPGDGVLCSTWSFSSPVMEVVRAGATPVFVDVDPLTLVIDLDDMVKKITPRTKAVLVTHFAGFPADIDEVHWLVDGKFLVIEDCAHVPFASRKGRVVGTDPRTAFSFWSLYATKTIGAGEGGLLGIRDEEAYQQAKKIRLHGFSKDAFDRYTSKTASWFYDVVCAGRKANMTDMVAAIALGQLERMDKLQQARENIAELYEHHLPREVELPPAVPPSAVQSRHLYVIKVPHSRDKFIEPMKEEGVQCSVHFRPIHQHTFYQSKFKADCPVADAQYERVVSLPIYPTMTPADIGLVLRAADVVAVKLYV